MRDLIARRRFLDPWAAQGPVVKPHPQQIPQPLISARKNRHTGKSCQPLSAKAAESTFLAATLSGLAPARPTSMTKPSYLRRSKALSLTSLGERGEGHPLNLLRRLPAGLFDREFERCKTLGRNNHAVASGQIRNLAGLARLNHLLGNIPGLGFGVERNRQQHLGARLHRIR